MKKGRKVIDLVGARFGRLVVTRFSHTLNGRGALWYAKCDCTGVERDKPYVYHDMARKTVQSCGCLRRERRGRPNLKDRKPNQEALKQTLFTSYKNDAVERGYSFHLTREEFVSLMEGPCYYCNKVQLNCIKSPWDIYRYNGIDRINNSLGYYLSNCVPCCGPHNRMKLNMNLETFIALCNEVAKNHPR